MIEREIGIELVNGLRHGRRERGRVATRSHDDVQRARWRLPVRHVERDPAVGLERVLLHASNDAHDGLPGRVGPGVAEPDALADRILARPDLAREKLVDDDHALARRAVLVGEEPPADERDLHRLEVAAGRDALIGVEERFAGRGRAAFDGDGSPREVLTERQ